MKKITTKEIKCYVKYIYEISGITLNLSKGYLIETRLRPLMHEARCEHYSDFLNKAKADTSGELRHKIVDAISTNETFFFRDSRPFELLRNKILPDLIDRRRKKNRQAPTPLRIWSAACSSGQELYSIAITLREMLLDVRAFPITILGTDISDKVIAQASYGKYSKFEVERGLPKQYLQRYFTRMGNEWRIKDEIRSMAQFNKINLLKPFPSIGKFDIIFCRNVAIYFSPGDRQKLFEKFSGVLAPDGALLLGGSESLNGMNLPFESKNYLKAIYYQPKGWEKKFEDTSVSSKPLPHLWPVASEISKGAQKIAGLVSRPIKREMPRSRQVIPQDKATYVVQQTTPKQISPPCEVGGVIGESVSSPSRALEKSEGPLQSHCLSMIRQQYAPGKSLIGTLQEKNRGSKPTLICRLTDTVDLDSGREDKSSLLAEISRRHKELR